MANQVTIIVPTSFVESMIDHLDNVGEASAEEVKEIAKELCPVDTGKLRDSIEVIKDGVDYVIGSSLEYSFDVEYGTRKQSPQPFIRPALTQVLSQSDT